MYKPRVLLSDYRQPDISAEIPFLFHRAGCVVDVYCARNSWLRKNVYHHNWYEAPVGDQSAYVSGLIACTEKQTYDWVVLTEDEAVRLVHDTVWNKVQSTSNEARLLATSKAEFSKICFAHGILTPSYTIVSVDEYIKENKDKSINKIIGNGMEEIKLPIVVKVDRSSGGEGVFLCHSHEDVSRVLCDIQKKNIEKNIDSEQYIVLQEYIKGDNVSCEALFQKGTLLACACSRVTSTTGGEFNVSAGRIYKHDPDVENILHTIGRTFNFDGFYNITFIQDTSSKKLYFIEADMRPNIWFSLTRYAGVDFSKAIKTYIDSNTHENSSECSSPLPASVLRVSGQGVPVWHFHRTISNLLMNGTIKDIFLGILPWVMNSKGRWRYMPIYDRKLFCAVCMYLCRLGMRRLGDTYPPNCVV